jgi:hypothetical protein
MSLEIPILVALLTGLVTAIGWLVAYRNAQVVQRRKDQLELVNKQIADLYGPLYVSCESGKSAYQALLKKLGRTKGVFNEDRPASDEEV